MKNTIGKIRSHPAGYKYLSLNPFPSEDIKHLVPSKVLQEANKAQFLLGKLSGITLLLPNVEYFINSYITKDATASSQIEGTRATIIDAFEYVADPSLQTDADDIAHYIGALNYGLNRLKKDDFPFSLRFIRELHNILMYKARSTHYANPGEFRTTQNWIGGTRPDNADFVPPAPAEINAPLRDIELFIHKPFLHPVIDVGLLHAQFETIHPFLDGNGRTGRLLITFYLIHHGFLDLPALFLSSFFKKHQKLYNQRLRQYHDGDILPWIEFFIDAVIATAKEAIEVSRKITYQRDKDLERIAVLTQSTSEHAKIVVRNLYKNPIVSSTTIQSWIGQSKPGTIKFIDRLINSGILELYKEGEGSKPSLYIHREYLSIFSND